LRYLCLSRDPKTDEEWRDFWRLAHPQHRGGAARRPRPQAAM